MNAETPIHYTEVVPHHDGYFVYWESATAYGARGSRLTRSQAERLAAELKGHNNHE